MFNKRQFVTRHWQVATTRSAALTFGTICMNQDLPPNLQSRSVAIYDRKPQEMRNK